MDLEQDLEAKKDNLGEKKNKLKVVSQIFTEKIISDHKTESLIKHRKSILSNTIPGKDKLPKIPSNNSKTSNDDYENHKMKIKSLKSPLSFQKSKEPDEESININLGKGNKNKSVDLLNK